MTASSATAPLVEPGPPLTPAEAARYSRHLSLPGVGVEGQRRLRNAKVLVIGAGGLGAPILQYLGAAGIGHLTVLDDDVVESSNLQRQVLHREADIGRLKVESARDALHRLDATLSVTALPERLTPENALELFAAHDLVLDGADNFATRYLSNDAAELTGTPLVWGTIFRFEGQASVFRPGHGPMLRDLFPDVPDADSVPSCAEGGVFGSLCAHIGSTMATEAIKLVCGIGEPLVGRLQRYDALSARTSELRFGPDPDRAPVESLEEIAVICGLGRTPAAPSTGHDVPEIPPAEAAARFSSGTAVLVDVREDWEREIVAVDGALSVPLGEIERDGWAAIDRMVPAPDGGSDRALVLLCKSGVRSVRAARALGDPSESGGRGFSSVSSLAGGVLRWAAEVEGETVVY